MKVDEYILWFRENAESLSPEVKYQVIQAIDRKEIVSAAKQLHVIRDEYGLPDNWDKMLEGFFGQFIELGTSINRIILRGAGVVRDGVV